MKKIILLLIIFVMSRNWADTNTLYTYSSYIQSGDRVSIGDQGEFIVVKPAQLAKLEMMIQDLQEKIDGMNYTERGREALHGKLKHTTVTNGMVLVKYADGFCTTNGIKRHAERRNAVKSPFSRRAHAQLEAIRKRRREALAVTNEVTVTIGE